MSVASPGGTTIGEETPESQGSDERTCPPSCSSVGMLGIDPRALFSIKGFID